MTIDPVCGMKEDNMNSQELDTAVRMETPFVVLVINDQSYGLIRWKQMLQFGRSAFVDFNARGYTVESADQLVPLLRAALSSNHLSIIDCPVDVSGNLLLTRRSGAITVPTGDHP